MKTLLAGAIMTAGGILAAGAETLTLVGSEAAEWDKTTACWTNSAGEACAFADGVAALIDDSIFTGGILSFATRVTPDTVLFNLAGDLVLTNADKTYGFGPDLRQWTKTGAGKLTVALIGRENTSLDYANVNTGRVDVLGGTLASGSIAFNLFGSCKNGFEMFVHNGATFLATDTFGTYNESEVCGLNLTVQTGGTYRISNSLSFVRDLTVNGGILDWAAGMSMYGPLTVYGKLTFGPAPAPITVAPPANANYFGIGIDGPDRRIMEIAVDDITGDDNVDVTFENYFMTVNTTKTMGMRKTGPGYVKFAARGGPSGGSLRTVKGPIRFEEGIAEFSEQGLFALNDDHTFYVSTNAELRITRGRPFYACNYHDNTASFYADDHLANLTVDHATLVISDQDSDNRYKQKCCDFLCGTLTLDHADFEYKDLLGSASGTLFQLGGLTYRNDHALDFNIRSGNNTGRATLRLYDLHPTVFDVGTTDGADYDLRIAMRMRDRLSYDSVNKCSIECRAGFVKQGPGRMLLDYRINEDSGNSNMFSGDIDVREGTLTVGPASSPYAPPSSDLTTGYLGNLTGNNGHRMLTVRTNATLTLNARFIFGTVTDNDLATGFTPPPIGMTLEGGTLKTVRGSAVIVDGLTVDGGATFDLGTVPDYDTPALLVPGTFRVKGSESVTLPAVDKCNFGFVASPETVFDVDDVTADAAADLSIAMPLVLPVGAVDNYGTVTNGGSYGFTKCGAGTLALSGGLVTALSTNRRYLNINGDIKVTGGTLRVDGDLSRSGTVTVSAGAALSGSGKVNCATLAEGAGFAADADAPSGALNVGGTLALPVTGAVYVSSASADVASRPFTLELFDAAAVSGEPDFASWSVYLNGKPAPATFRLSKKGSVLRVRNELGMAVFVR